MSRPWPRLGPSLIEYRRDPFIAARIVTVLEKPQPDLGVLYHFSFLVLAVWRLRHHTRRAAVV